MIHRIPGDNESITTIVQKAGQALYEAKERGRTKFTFRAILIS